MDYRAVLKRAGIVLLGLGFIEIAFKAYFGQVSLQAPIGFVFGVFLWQGSLRAASLLRWCAMLALPWLAGSLLPLLQPWDLTRTQWRLYPGQMALGVALGLLLVAMSAWLIRTLGSAPVESARAEQGRPRRDLRIPLAIGTVSLAVLILVLGRSGSSARAKKEAEAKLGAGFQYHVSALNVTHTTQGTFASAQVTAWNAGQIVTVPVQWRE